LTCVDVGRVAKRYPDVNLLIYHSGFVTDKPERAYDPQRSDGIDALCTSLRANGVKPGSNVYAELGSTWRFLMRDPDSAAHGLGKLFQHVGEDNVLWGTDSIWYGSPQDQIQAFLDVPDRRRPRGATRLSQDHAGASHEGLRPQRLACVQDIGRRAEATFTSRSRGAGASRLSRVRRPDVSHARPEDAARIPESHGLDRSGALIA
jgi:hypothetical protein